VRARANRDTVDAVVHDGVDRPPQSHIRERIGDLRREVLVPPAESEVSTAARRERPVRIDDPGRHAREVEGARALKPHPKSGPLRFAPRDPIEELAERDPREVAHARANAPAFRQEGLVLADGHAGGVTVAVIHTRLHGRQVEPTSELEHCLVILGDPLGAELHDGSICERGRPDPAADALASFDPEHLDAAIGQVSRCRQAGETGTNHHDAPRRIHVM
jgi:hypothetical protein